MKRLSVASCAAVFCAVGLLGVPHAAFAASNASDSASNYTSSTWATGSNLGSGFGAWNLFGSSGNSGYYGNYIGGTGLSSNSFGIYAGDANSGASFDAQRPFTGALTAGQTFSVDLGHTPIQSNGSVGLNFQSVTNGTATNVFSVIANGTTVYLNDGGSNFGVQHAADQTNTDLKFTFTYNGGSSYSFTLTGSSGGTNYTASSNISDINQVQLYDFQQGSGENFGFDNISIVPEPSTIFGGAAMVFGGAYVFWHRRRAVPPVFA